MDLALEIIGELGDSAPPLTEPPLAGSPLAEQLTAWGRQHEPAADPATALRAMLAWSRLHGFVSLEIAGNFASMSIDPDPLFEIQLAAPDHLSPPGCDPCLAAAGRDS